ncbi:MAG: serine kinase [Pseudomonadota bacterium]
MILSEIVAELGLKVLAGGDALNREVTGGYAGDLLSDVMANSQKGHLWVTLQGHVNVVAVGVLRELAGIVLIKDRTPAPDTLAKAQVEGLPILQSSLHAFELTGRLYTLLGAR